MSKNISRAAEGLLCLYLITTSVFGLPKASAALDCSAAAGIVIEMQSGNVIYEQNAFQPLPPASTTKIITAITTIEMLPLDTICTVSPKAEAIDEASIYLTAGEQLTALDLLYGAMLKSANDACFCLAETIAGTEPFFVKLLNWKAFALGAYTAQLYNTNGLPNDRHKMSAYDLAMIARYAMSNPVFAEICKTPAMTLSDGRYVRNINKLLQYDPSYIGIKTGTTVAAGPCLVSAQKVKDKIYIAVVLNSRDRYGDSIRLLNFAASQ